MNLILFWVWFGMRSLSFFVMLVMMCVLCGCIRLVDLIIWIGSGGGVSIGCW